MRKADFECLRAVLDKKKPPRPTLFEFGICNSVLQRFCPEVPGTDDLFANALFRIRAFNAAGYDYACVAASGFRFPACEHDKLKSVSSESRAVITNRVEYDRYVWPNPENFSMNYLAKIDRELIDGMKLLIKSPGGVLENVVQLCGYAGLSMLIVDDYPLVEAVFENIGRRLCRYFKDAVQYKAVGGCVLNDDWGFKTQTMLSPELMRRLVFPWHAKIVDVVHEANMPILLHSCGNLEEVMDDIIDNIGFDGKHSFEDAILPVEEAYRRYNGRIAILGGIDVDFLCRSAPDQISARCRSMLELAASDGGFALGSGNTIPEYVPFQNYRAMIDTAALRSNL